MLKSRHMAKKLTCRSRKARDKVKVVATKDEVYSVKRWSPRCWLRMKKVGNTKSQQGKKAITRQSTHCGIFCKTDTCYFDNPYLRVKPHMHVMSIKYQATSYLNIQAIFTLSWSHPSNVCFSSQQQEQLAPFLLELIRRILRNSSKDVKLFWGNFCPSLACYRWTNMEGGQYRTYALTQKTQLQNPS